MSIFFLRKFFIGVVILITTSSIITGQKIPPSKPKLIVGITVSGMRYDYLSVYWDKFGDDGFRKMATTGTNFKNARYGYLITDPSSGYASIATGSMPSKIHFRSHQPAPILRPVILYFQRNLLQEPETHG